MSFRTHNEPPSAFLVRPGGLNHLCQLQALPNNKLSICLDRELITPLQVGESVRMTIDPENRDPEQCAQAIVAGRLSRPKTYLIDMADPKSFHASAEAAQEYNRRTCFRVCTRDLLPGIPKNPDESLKSTIHQAGQEMTAELLDLSLTGCGVRVRRNGPKAPALGTRLILTVQGGDLPEILQLPARVERYQEQTKNIYLGLAFLKEDERLWNRVERQISSYLMQRQQSKIRRKAG